MKRPFAHAFLRDRYFPGKPMSVSLEYRVVKDGKVVAARTLLESPDGRKGLAVAHGFVTAMGGRLDLEDTPGGGLTAVVTLPVAPTIVES